MSGTAAAEDRELDLIVHDRIEAADDVVILVLRNQDGGALPKWSPGAHLDLVLGADLVRQYSLCGSPGDDARMHIGVRRETYGRGGSQYVHDNLFPGTAVRARGPRNNFEFDSAASSCLFIAGGIGITALMPMIAAAHRAGVEWVLHYVGRDLAHMVFRDELAAFGDRVRLYPRDRVRRPDIDDIVGAAAPGATVYCCGPASVIEAAEDAAAHHQLPIHVEYFVPKQRDAPVWEEAFEVELAQTGVTITVPPDRSILEVAEEAGAMIVSSCQEGTCGTCETPILEGVPDHRDSVLSDETDVMMICVSRAACPRLVLDL
ncbi:PDR/VanB family oxidoreductase [Nocardia jiangxiensis]|uniref:PDR/VanB family oxidoreductase n=1 Tax=Nocardia jiangxiensis TaxID=282685 RepID=A0ABW6RZ11_9NOCA